MIFLKKIYAAVTAAALIALTGCSHSASVISGADAPAETTMATIEPVTAEPLPDVTGLPAAESNYVFDNAGLLSSEEKAALNSYCEMLYRERLINAAVVTTDDIGEKTPYQFADDNYNEIYQGRGSGFLLLVNNDTNSDYLYRTGSCLAAVPEGADSLAFYWATKDMVAGDYYSAVLRESRTIESSILVDFMRL